MTKTFTPIELSDGQRLIAAMLADLYQPAEDRELDGAKILSAIVSGQTWSIRAEYHHLFDDHEDSAADVEQVARDLDMWRMIERAVAAWTPDETAAYEAQVSEHDRNPQYMGYDGNGEAGYGIAKTWIEDLGRWSEFEGRAHNAHMPTAERYARMEKVFRPMLENLSRRELTPDEVAQIIDAGKSGA